MNLIIICLKLTITVSVPVTELPKYQRVFIDLGLQMNYVLPYQLSDFYNVPIWPKDKIEEHFAQRHFKRAPDNFRNYSIMDFYKTIEIMFKR